MLHLLGTKQKWRYYFESVYLKIYRNQINFRFFLVHRLQLKNPFYFSEADSAITSRFELLRNKRSFWPPLIKRYKFSFSILVCQSFQDTCFQWFQVFIFLIHCFVTYERYQARQKVCRFDPAVESAEGASKLGESGAYFPGKFLNLASLWCNLAHFQREIVKKNVTKVTVKIACV